jgi:heme exporter protein D
MNWSANAIEWIAIDGKVYGITFFTLLTIVSVFVLILNWLLERREKYLREEEEEKERRKAFVQLYYSNQLKRMMITNEMVHRKGLEIIQER